jgi:hypothetical protein
MVCSYYDCVKNVGSDSGLISDLYMDPSRAEYETGKIIPDLNQDKKVLFPDPQYSFKVILKLSIMNLYRDFCSKVE